MLTYAEVPLEQLRFGVNRPQSWWDEHPNTQKMIYKMMTSIMRNIANDKKPLNNPLSAINKNDGTYEVTVGNQRLQALTNMSTITPLASTIIVHKSGQGYIIGDIIGSMAHLQSYFTNDIGNCNLEIDGCFQITPSDVDEWDGDKVYGS